MSVAIIAALLVLVGCGSGDPVAAPSSPTSATTTITAAAARTPGALADELDAQFAALPDYADPPCSPARAQTKTCADYLTQQVQLVTKLDAELRARDDAKSRYLDTLLAIQKVLDESARYADARCFAGGGTQEDCHGIAMLIGTGTISVQAILRSDDLDR
ncbi:hypothetical protein [Lentzea sp. CA-135723]|uniref:hypothetical protein n=1 Tax=Lentzea sp. CA-135723 TaxID=3239950 RepID=UPI003D8E9534